MDTELSKRERKIARELTDKGIAEDFKRGLLGFDAVLQRWKQEGSDNGECFRTLYGNVREFNKMIAWRYDKISGRQYIDTLIFQLLDGLYEPAELGWVDFYLIIFVNGPGTPKRHEVLDCYCFK